MNLGLPEPDPAGQEPVYAESLEQSSGIPSQNLLRWVLEQMTLADVASPGFQRTDWEAIVAVARARAAREEFDADAVTALVGSLLRFRWRESRLPPRILESAIEDVAEQIWDDASLRSTLQSLWTSARDSLP